MDFRNKLKRAFRVTDENQGLDQRTDLTIEDIEDITQAGEQSIINSLDEHFDNVHEVQNQYALSNEQLISESLKFNKELPRKLRKNVAALGTQIRSKISEIAEIVENYNFKSVDEALDGMNLTQFNENRAKSIIDSQKKLHVSYQSIKIAIHIFQRVNIQILKEIERARSSGEQDRQTDLLFKNALIVYELANTIVDVFDSFSDTAENPIQDIYDDILAELERNKKNDEEAKRKYKNDPNLTESIRKQTLDAISEREKLRRVVKEEWSNFIKRMKQIEENARGITNQVVNIEAIRDNARNQLDFLQIVAITKMAKDNIDAVQGLLDITDIPLAPLSPEDLKKLFGSVNSP